MYARLVDRYVRRVYERFNAGDAEPAIRRFARGSRLIFHGRSRLAADLRTKPEIASWLRELMQLKLRWEVSDVLVRGTPWNTRVVTCATITAPRGQDGFEVAYPAVQYARLRWGRVYLDEILPDTQAVAGRFPERHPGGAAGGYPLHAHPWQHS